MTLLLQYMLMFCISPAAGGAGWLLLEHSGVINIGLEGIMVFGALGGALMMKYMPDGTAVVVVILPDDADGDDFRDAVFAPAGGRGN